MVTVRGRKKSLAPRMAPPRDVRRRTESESEEELLEEDSNVSNEVSEATFIEVRAEGGDGAVGTTVGATTGESDNGVNNVVAGTNVIAGTDAHIINAREVVPKPLDPVTQGELNQSNGSTDSGHSEHMDTTEKVEDDAMAGLYSSVSILEEQIRNDYPVTARPPCTVDAEMVSAHELFTRNFA